MSRYRQAFRHLAAHPDPLDLSRFYLRWPIPAGRRATGTGIGAVIYATAGTIDFYA